MPLKVSIVMPVYNRGFMLKQVIESLLGQTYKKIEFILVDNGSTDNTADVIKSFPQVRYVYRPNGGCAAARNTGIKNASGDIVLFIDSDVICPADLAGTHAACHEKDPCIIVQGQLVRIVRLEDACKVPFSMIHYSRSFFDTANVSVRLEHLKKVGGFDEITFRKGWEDLDIGLRLLDSGLKVRRLVKKAYVWHYEGDYSREAVMEFFKDRYNEGQQAVLFYRKHPTFAIKQMVMATGFFFLLSRLLFSESYLKSAEFYNKIKNLIGKGRINKAIALTRYNGYCFYMKGLKDKIRQDGYLLKKR